MSFDLFHTPVGKVGEVLSRRKGLALASFLLPLGLAMTAILAAPDLYRAHTTLLVQQDGTEDARSGSDDAVNRETRLQTIRKALLSRTRLVDTMERFALYPSLRTRSSPDSVVEAMRRDIAIDLDGAPQAWGGVSTVSLTLKYQNRDPEIAAAVANALAGSWIEENGRIREQQAYGTAEALGAQLDGIRQRQEEQDAKLREFKSRHMGSLPQQIETNMAAVSRLNSRLELNHDDRRRVAERREELVRSVSTVSGIDGEGTPETLDMRLTRLRRDLADLKTRYSDSYPDIVQLKETIAATEALQDDDRAQADEALPVKEAAARAEGKKRPLTQSLEKVNAELRALDREEQSLRNAIADYERRIESSPRLEQEYSELSRDYETTKQVYGDLLKRYEEARLLETHERDGGSQQLRVLDAAIPPVDPYAPDRFRLVLGAVLLALAFSAAILFVREKLDPSFHRADDLRAFTRVPILASIPPTSTLKDRIGARLKAVGVTLLVAVCLLIVVTAAYAYTAGNEELTRLMARVSS